MDYQAKWDAKYKAGTHQSRIPTPLLVQQAEFLPDTGRALDVAGGAGRHSVWLAQQGLDVTLVDLSPVGIDLAEQRASENGVQIHTIVRDIEVDPLPPGPWDVIVSCYFLWRPLFKKFAQQLNVNGRLIVVQPTKTNLQRHEKPPADFLLEDGELPQLVEPLEILYSDEGWLAEDRHEAVIVATKR